MVGLRAPARRAGLPFGDATLWTDNGRLLFEAAIKWAVKRTVPALLVANSATLGVGDEAVNARLAHLGYAVSVKTAAAVTAVNAEPHAVVLISGSADANALGTKLQTLPVPVLTWQPRSFNKMDLCGPQEGTDFGFTETQDELQIVAAHPVAGGLSGRERMTSISDTFGWARVPGSAEVATLVGFSWGSGLFAYEKDTNMVSLRAPARRVGLFFSPIAPAFLWDEGKTVFDAAVTWAGNADPDVDDLTTYEEFKRGCDPADPDTDDDTYEDGVDAAPLNPAKH
jgi:hypothetical protein